MCCTRWCLWLWIVGVNSWCSQEGMGCSAADESFFRRRAGFLRSNTVPLVSLALLFETSPISSKEDVLVVNSLLVFLIPTAFRKPLAKLAYVFGVLLSGLWMQTPSMEDMDCLQLGYRMWILMVCIDSVVVVDRKGKDVRSVAPKKPSTFSRLLLYQIPFLFPCDICNASIAI